MLPGFARAPEGALRLGDATLAHNYRFSWRSEAMMQKSLFGAAVFAAAISSMSAGCHKPKAVRGSDTPGLDYAAMGTGLDRRDLSQMLRENLDAMKGSRVYTV